MFRVLAGDREANPRDEAGLAVERSVRISMILSFSVIGLALTYFAALYVIVR